MKIWNNIRYIADSVKRKELIWRSKEREWWTNVDYVKGNSGDNEDYINMKVLQVDDTFEGYPEIERDR